MVKRESKREEAGERIRVRKRKGEIVREKRQLEHEVVRER